MSFYQTISPYYAGLFPVDAVEIAFLSSRLAGVKRLLDIGCGVGNKTICFSSFIEEIVAFDGDEAMIEKARADYSRPQIRYDCLDMRSMGSSLAGPGFDAALCLGNTLVHLDGPGAIRFFLESLHELLRPDGLFILQILNYDRILDRNITALPPLESEQAVFSRSYHRAGDLIHFVTRLTVKADGQAFDNDVPLYPLRKAELEQLLAQTGFAPPLFHGDSHGGPYSADSFACLALCKKL